MAYTTTAGITFTKTHAEHIASKVAADLYQMQRFYGSPSDANIEKYKTEFVAYVADGYLTSIDYGFKKDGKWVLALSYEISDATGAIKDDNSGKIPIGKDITGAVWSSFLRESTAFYRLSSDEQNKFLATLPFQRNGAPDPLSGLVGIHDKTYSAGGTNANRRIIT